MPERAKKGALQGCEQTTVPCGFLSCEIHEGGPAPLIDERSKERCSDGGRCHHDCGLLGACSRVNGSGPLSGVYPGNEWPREVLAAEAMRAGGATIEARLARQDKLQALAVASARPVDREAARERLTAYILSVAEGTNPAGDGIVHRSEILDAVLGADAQAEPKTLTFVQGCDWVWVELDGERVWEESSWGSFGQFQYAEIGEGPFIIKFAESDEDH